MLRTALCLIFLTLCLNVSRISTDETTPSQKATSDSTAEPRSHADDTVDSKEGVTNTATESFTETAVKKTDEQNQNKIRSVSSNEVDQCTNDSEHKSPTPSKHTTEVNSDVDDIIAKPVRTFRDDQTTTRMQSEENGLKDSTRRIDPGHITKLASSLFLPAIKATDRYGKAWNQAAQGTKDIGGGTHEATAGTFDLLRSLLFSSG